jgi:hypothetical protein
MRSIKINNKNEKLSAIETGKLWATYMGNSMAKCVLTHFLGHTEDPEILKIVQYACGATDRFAKTIKAIFEEEAYPVPIGFTDKDVNPEAPRLFEDEFYLHYLRYIAKASISLYGTAVPILVRSDVRELFTECLKTSIDLVNMTNDVLIEKGMIAKPPSLPIPEQVRLIQKQSYMGSLFNDTRPLQALEITHLYDNAENNATSKGVLIGFIQTAQLEDVKHFFEKGIDISTKHYDVCSKVLEKENLPFPPVFDHLVTKSTTPTFSDKLMMFHKLDMFSMRIRTYGNSLSLCARKDLSAKYGRFVFDVGQYAEEGAKQMITHKWMEEPPQAVDREVLASK